MSICYILKSEKLNKYYIGASNVGVKERIVAHNNGKYGSKSFTAKATDWVLILEIEAESFAHAHRMELKIKSMKSKKYVENLVLHPELVRKVFLETIE